MEEQKEQTAKEPAAGAQPGFGKLLRSLREKAGLSLDDVANRTKISRGQLDAASSGTCLRPGLYPRHLPRDGRGPEAGDRRFCA